MVGSCCGLYISQIAAIQYSRASKSSGVGIETGGHLDLSACLGSVW